MPASTDEGIASKVVVRAYTICLLWTGQRLDGAAVGVSSSSAGRPGGNARDASNRPRRREPITAERGSRPAREWPPSVAVDHDVEVPRPVYGQLPQRHRLVLERRRACRGERQQVPQARRRIAAELPQHLSRTHRRLNGQSLVARGLFSMTTCASGIRAGAGAAASRAAIPDSRLSKNGDVGSARSSPSPVANVGNRDARMNAAHCAPKVVALAIALVLLPEPILGVEGIQLGNRELLELPRRCEGRFEVLGAPSDDRYRHPGELVGGDHAGLRKFVQCGRHRVQQRSKTQPAVLVDPQRHHHQPSARTEFATAERDELVPVVGGLSGTTRRARPRQCCRPRGDGRHAGC